MITVQHFRRIALRKSHAYWLAVFHKGILLISLTLTVFRRVLDRQHRGPIFALQVNINWWPSKPQWAEVHATHRLRRLATLRVDSENLIRQPAANLLQLQPIDILWSSGRRYVTHSGSYNHSFRIPFLSIWSEVPYWRNSLTTCRWVGAISHEVMLSED